MRPAVAMTLTLLALQACVTPSTVYYYDEECRVDARKMVLDTESFIAVNRCVNQECLAQLVAGLAVAATSTIVSGSIVIVGNIVYWAEKKQNCRRAREAPEPAAAPSAPRA